MATSVSKAVLVNISAFLADNGIRRSVGTFALNFSSPSSNVVNNYMTLNPGETFAWNSPGLPNSVTLLSTEGPLTCDFNLAGPPAASYSITVNKAHLVDTSVASLVITNPGTTAVRFVLIQS